VFESIVRDQIVLGVENKQVREKLLFETDLTLAKACSIVRAFQSASSQLIHMASRSDSIVHRLTYNSPKERSSANIFSKIHQNSGNGQ
jgi:hypothetical protein